VANKTCGAFGLNLQFCHNVIFYNNDFNLATRLQAEDRVHRLGQDHDVHVYDIICPDSIDGFISDCLNRKANMAETFIERIKDVQREVQNKKLKKYARKLTSLKPRSEGSVSSSKSSKTSI
jgi:SNF2 family DNA or RNA helicase